ncbi:MAG: phosphoenolpyruvate--protein phosphotransferase [Parvularculaceae bacterium]|nr:phosphoenolpyruvate--protein phosphotransferase [Parvularculaceae bacterium]
MKRPHSARRAKQAAKAAGGIAILLKSMHDAVAVASTAQDRLDALTHAIARHVGSDVCSIYLRLASDELELYSTEGLNREAVHKTRLKWGEGLVGVVAETQRPLITADAPLHPNFAYRPETGEDPLHSFLGVPLIRSGKSLGVLVLQNLVSRRYTDEEAGAATAVATLLAEIAASGELLDQRTTDEVGAMLHRPERLKGAGIVPGVARGRAAFHEAPTPKHKVFGSDAGAEVARLDQGIAALQAAVDAMLARETLEDAPREVLETYRLFAYDRGWKERMRAAAMSGLTAEAAVEQVQAENRSRMAQIKDPYLRERMHDLDDLSRRLLRHLTGTETAPIADLPEAAILIARVLGPAELLEYDRTRLKGLVIVEASATSHVAIVARALGVPLVAGTDSALGLAEAGDEIIVDGETGEVLIRPTTDVMASYREKEALQSEQQAAFASEKHLPSVSRDGVAIELFMNAGIPLDMAHLERTGAAGVGLFRTELQFIIGAQLPRAGAQEKLYAQILALAGDKPVVFRTADLGADKAGAYMTVKPEANPAMGWRGLRMAIDRPGLFRPQLRALLGALAGRPAHILFPMITVPDEVGAARDLIAREVDFANRRGKPLPSEIRLGAMIETPAAAWRVDDIAARVDFLSIGGNDLAQFYFAADRDAEMTQRRFDALDPGFLSFISRIAEAAARAGKPLTYCGEQAADPLMAAALVGAGLRRFSSPASAIGPIRRLVRSIEVSAVSDWLNGESRTKAPLRRAFAEFLAKSGAAVP